MSFLKKWQEHKLFRPIMTAALCLNVLFMIFLMDEQVSYLLKDDTMNWLPLIGCILLEITGLWWLSRAIGWKEVVGGVSWVVTLLYPFILYFCVEWLCFGSLSDTLKFFFRHHFYMMLFMVALLSAIFWTLNMIWRRFWISSTVMSIVMMILAYINIAKIGINGDPLLPTDLAFASKLGDLTGFAQGALPFTKELVFTVLVLLGVSLLLFFGGKKSTKNWILRPIVSILCVAFVLLTVMIPAVKDYMFLADSIDMSRQYRQTVVYGNHGFMGGFIINIEGYVAPPEGYSKNNIAEMISTYSKDTDGDTSNFESPDVIVYLGESVFDITQIKEIEFSEDPLKVLHMLEDKYLSGTMLQASGVGGGTVRSEFEVLTGINLVDMKEGLIPYNTYVPKSQEQVYGLPNYFKDLGYTTIGIHSYDKTFYSRDICYGRMGFDEFIGEQDMPDAEHDLNSRRQFIYDSYFVKQIEKQLEKETEGSKFIFAISMENHGQFTDKYPEYDQIATFEGWDEKENGIANCYIKSTKAADEALGELYEYVMNREKPTVVLWYGDHLPTLNERHTVLEKTGFISTGWSEEWGVKEYYNMYRTPFVIFSNYMNKEQSAVGDYSSYMLPTLLLDYIDAPKNGYWNLLSAMHDEVKAYNRLVTIDGKGNVAATHTTENGVAVGTALDALSDEARKLVETHTLISYDALAGKRYINDILLEDQK